MKKIILLLLLCSPAVAGSERRLVRIRIDRPEQAQALLRMNLDLASRCISDHADAVLSSDEERALQRQGFSITPLTSAASLAKTTAALSGDMGAYHTYQELGEELAALAESYPAILRLTSIGRSVEGRELWAVKISDHPGLEEADEAEVLLTAAIHAREIITPEILLDLIHYITTQYGQDTLLTRLVDERQIWLVPMINPDGHVRVEEGDIWWRKNCRINADGSVGVDLNRNFGYNWGWDNYGSSPTPTSETYRGTGPFSEPETAALRDFTAAHHFAAVINYHSYSRLALFPWSFTALHTSHHAIFMELGRNLTRVSGYEYGDLAMGVLYSTNGDADDYFYGSSLGNPQPTFSLTIEVGTEFHPPESEMVQLIAENRPASLYICYIADRLRLDPWRILPDSVRTTVAPRIPPLTGAPSTGLPAGFSLAQNWPNPFNATTTLSYTLAREARVHLALFDTRGRLVRLLMADRQTAGEHRIRIEASDLPSGFYFCRMEAGAVAGTTGAAAGNDELASDAESWPAIPGTAGHAVIRLLLLR
ncbi:MAG TPA: M14 family zinc carboxypeptidase [bacterium]|nr:M14 family zinc carboxypeptidase [bacterium]